MNRALSIPWCLAAIAVRAEVKHEVFPVPPAVATAFESGGLAAFDPFDPWNGGVSRTASRRTPASPGADSARLPSGACYDILPAWTSRGFKPHEGTRVWFHPDSSLLFAAMAPEDAARVQALCDWPAAVWLAPASGIGRVKQVLYRVTAWEVPAIGPGDWTFRPETPAELLALPESARRIIGRHGMVMRGGQRSKSESVALTLSGQTGSGMVTEAECTIADDDLTVDLNQAPELAVPGSGGDPMLLQVVFPQWIRWGDSWLLEAGTIPGNPPRRIFEVFSALRLHDQFDDGAALDASAKRWTGRPAANGTGKRRVIQLRIPLPGQEPEKDSLLPPAVRPPPDPFEPGPVARPAPLLPRVKVPDLFGSAEVEDHSATIIALTGAPQHSLQAWCAPGRSQETRFSPGGPFFIRGTEAGIAALDQWTASRRGPDHIRQCVVDATVELRRHGSATPVWRNSLTLRSAQRSGVRLSAGSSSDEDDAPHACLLDFEAEFQQPDTPKSVNDGVWNLTIGGILAPPLIAQSVTIPALSNVFRHDTGVHHHQAGFTNAGDEIVIALKVRDSAVMAPLKAIPAPLLDLWWSRSRN